MDLSKLPFDRLFYFIAGIIPGFIALLIFQVAHPGAFTWFFSLGFFGYKTILAIILLICFVIGNTITVFLTATTGSVGGMIGAVTAGRPYRPSHTFNVAPWRDQKWRSALKAYLGAEAPKDTLLMTQAMYDQRQQMISAALPLLVPMLTAATAELNLEKLNSEIEDGRWRDWYEHFHRLVLFRSEGDAFYHVRIGLNSNMQAAALYVLVSALLVPAVRHWWCMVPACGWFLVFLAETYSAYARYGNRWSTMFEQINYLSKARAIGEK